MFPIGGLLRGAAHFLCMVLQIPVSLRRFAYVAVSRASQDAMLFTDNAALLGLQLAVETSKTAVLDAEQVASIANAVGMSR